MAGKPARVDFDRNWIGRGNGGWDDWLFGGACGHDLSRGIRAVIDAARFFFNESLLIAIEGSPSDCRRVWSNLCIVGSSDALEKTGALGVDVVRDWHHPDAANWTRRAKRLSTCSHLAANGTPLRRRRFLDSPDRFLSGTISKARKYCRLLA